MVQAYLPDPLLVDGRKFDLRLYVVLTCASPLQAFLSTRGVARFATATAAQPGGPAIRGCDRIRAAHAASATAAASFDFDNGVSSRLRRVLNSSISRVSTTSGSLRVTMTRGFLALMLWSGNPKHLAFTRRGRALSSVAEFASA